MFKEGRNKSVRVGQCNPELNAVEHVCLGVGYFGVGDARARGHQVELPGRNHLMRSHTVAVLDFAGKQPRHGLQSRVRVGCDRHPAGIDHAIGAEVIDKAPRTDCDALAIR